MPELRGILIIQFGICVFRAHGDTPVWSSIHYDWKDPTAGVAISWPSKPDKQYSVRVTRALGEPWRALTAEPLVAKTNLMVVRDVPSDSTRFYTVVKLDTEAPEIWHLSPSDHAIAIGRQSPLRLSLTDETGIDWTSVSLTVGSDLPVNLNDPRLTLTNGVLFYTPRENEFLGGYGETVVVGLRVSDVLGNSITNYPWSFDLEALPVVAEGLIFIGRASEPAMGLIGTPGLTLLAVDNLSVTCRYGGDSSGLETDQVLVSGVSTTPFARVVESVDEDPQTHIVVAQTKPAPLSRLFQGSFPVRDVFSRRVSLAGTVFYDDSNLRIEVISGGLEVNLDYTVGATVGFFEVTSFDASIIATFTLDPTFRASITQAGKYEPPSKPLLPEIRHAIPVAIPGLPLPIIVDAVFHLNCGAVAEFIAQGAVTGGFHASETITVEARLREGRWTHGGRSTASLSAIEPQWNISGSMMAQGYVEAKLEVLLYGFIGLSANLKPYLEFDAFEQAIPKRYSRTLIAGLRSDVAIESSVWDDNWFALPSWRVLDLRRDIWHNEHNGLPEMAFVPSGRFDMGDHYEVRSHFREEVGPVHSVFVSAFYMDRFEVTKALWDDVRNWAVNRNYSFGSVSADGPNFPVSWISWHDAVKWCNARSEREQLKPVYYTDSTLTTVFKSGTIEYLSTDSVDWSANGYRLPTEAEWEKAARGGMVAQHFPWPSFAGSYLQHIDGSKANYACSGDPFEENSQFCFGATPVGYYDGRQTPRGIDMVNGYGLYDMAGNVSEWCWDWYRGDWYGEPEAAEDDTHGPISDDGRRLRVIRGGSHRDGIELRCASRSIGSPDHAQQPVGFRCVRRL